MSVNAPTPSELIDERLKRDLRATVGLNLMMAGIWLSDGQLAALVDLVAARVEGELRLRRLQAIQTPEVTA